MKQRVIKNYQLTLHLNRHKMLELSFKILYWKQKQDKKKQTVKNKNIYIIKN